MVNRILLLPMYDSCIVRIHNVPHVPGGSRRTLLGTLGWQRMGLVSNLVRPEYPHVPSARHLWGPDHTQFHIKSTIHSLSRLPVHAERNWCFFRFFLFFVVDDDRVVISIGDGAVHRSAVVHVVSVADFDVFIMDRSRFLARRLWTSCARPEMCNIPFLRCSVRSFEILARLSTVVVSVHAFKIMGCAHVISFPTKYIDTKS